MKAIDLGTGEDVEGLLFFVETSTENRQCGWCPHPIRAGDSAITCETDEGKKLWFCKMGCADQYAMGEPVEEGF